MNGEQAVLAAAEARAAALASGDAEALLDLLHPQFQWTSHHGDRFDRDGYVRRNTGDAVSWKAQEMGDIEVVVVGDAAVLTCTVTDEVDAGEGFEVYTMPMTQTLVREDGRWLCLAGHTGPRLHQE
jgi:uncharacterized protein (TIGR02246 family)